MGKKVYVNSVLKPAGEQLISFDSEKLKQGIYVIRITTPDGVMFSKKFIKME